MEAGSRRCSKDKDGYIALLRKRVAAQDTSQLPKHLLRRLAVRGPDQGPPTEESQELDFSRLDEDPELQQSLAYQVQYTPSKWLLEREAGLIADRRDLHDPEHKMPRFQQSDPNEDIYEWARTSRLTGLCFSGGGIRSATFNLGMLQGLAVKGWLDQVDYLSSVSGGGYIHSWLAAWLKRKTTELGEERKPLAEPELAAWRHVMSRLVPLPHHEPGQWFQAVWPTPDPVAAQVQQLPHAAQGSIHRRYLVRGRVVDTQCVGEPGAADLDLSGRALCAPSRRAPRASPVLPRSGGNEQIRRLLGHGRGSQDDAYPGSRPSPAEANRR